MPFWDPVKLQKTLVERLTVSELRQVAFELGIPYVDLPGDTRVDKTREMVLYLAHRGRLDHLIHWLQVNRDDIDAAVLTSDLPLPPRVTQADTHTDQLAEWYVNGLAAFHLKRWDEAVRLFALIVAQHPAYEQAAAKLAEAKRRQQLEQLQAAAAAAEAEKRWVEAIHAWEALVALDPQNKTASGRLESVRRRHQLSEYYDEARRLYRAEQWQAVVNVIEQIHELDAKYADAEGLLKGARKALAAIERERKVATLYSEGLRHIDGQAWEEAARCFQAIQKLVKGHRDTDVLLTRTRQELDAIRRQEEKARQMQARREEKARQEQSRREQEEQARATQEQEARLSREIKDLWQQLETAEAAEDWRMVIRRARSILSREPTHQRAKAKLAVGYVGRSQTYQPGELQQAIGDLTRAIELFPTQANYYAMRAGYQRGKAALADLEKALELAPGNAEYRRRRDQLQKELADSAARDEAQRAFWERLKAQGIGMDATPSQELPAPIRPPILAALEWRRQDRGPELMMTAKEADETGQNLAQRGEHQRAIPYFDRAIELEPESAAFYAHRGRSYHVRGEFERAIADYDTAIRLGVVGSFMIRTDRDLAQLGKPPFFTFK